MRSAHSDECIVCGPFTEESAMVEFEDRDGDPAAICVDCLMGIFTAIDFPPEAMAAFAQSWTSQVLGLNLSAVSDE